MDMVLFGYYTKGVAMTPPHPIHRAKITSHVVSQDQYPLVPNSNVK